MSSGLWKIENGQNFLCQFQYGGGPSKWQKGGKVKIATLHPVCYAPVYNTKKIVRCQVAHDSDEGLHYATFYTVRNYPHISVIDPRTGELNFILS